MRARALVILALIAALAAWLPAATSAAPRSEATAKPGGGSILYTRGGDIWRAAPDGKRKRRIARGRGQYFWSQAAQADDGRVLAVLGPARVWTRMTKRGRRVGKAVPTPGWGLGLAFDEARRRNGDVGPLGVQLSPDGRLATYWGILEYARAFDPDAVPPQPRFILDQSPGAIVSMAGRDRTIDTDGSLYDLAWPSFYGDGNVLFSVIDGTLRRYGLWYLPAGQTEPQSWVTVAQTYFPFTQPEISRAGDLLTLVTDRRAPGQVASGDDEFGFIRLAGPPPALPTTACAGIPNPNGKIEEVSWSPDGTRIAWSDRRGVWTGRPVIAPGPGAELPCTLEDRRLIAPGGHAPDWGPAAP